MTLPARLLTVLTHTPRITSRTCDDIDLCVRDPGHEVDVYFTSSVKTLADIWMGENTYRSAMQDGSLKVVGPSALADNIASWMRNAILSAASARDDA